MVIALPAPSNGQSVTECKAKGEGLPRYRYWSASSKVRSVA
jgi:hypothetical protein